MRNMRLEILEDKVLIWETGSQNNKILFDSTTDLSIYRRRSLADFELLLVNHKQYELSNKINKYLGKIIRAKDIDDLLIPDGNYRVNINLSHLKDTIDKYVNEDGLDLDPDFQRAHVWDMPKRISYMEFLLKGGKSNPIYFNHEGWMNSFDGEMVIVDGKQRLTSILMFLNDEYPTFKDIDKEGIGYYASEFDFIPNNIEIIINSLPNRELVLKWYLQMNEGNVAHTKEELDKVRNMLKGCD